MAAATLPPSNLVAKEIPGLPGYYAIDDGRIWSSVRGRFMTGCPGNQYGHLVVCIGRSASGNPKVHYVHKLVALAFHGESDKQVRHLDDNGLNNRADNLAYGSWYDNMRDSKRSGVIESGAEGWHTAATTQQMRRALEMYVAGAQVWEIEDETSVARWNLRSMLSGVTWKLLPKCPFEWPVVRRRDAKAGSLSRATIEILTTFDQYTIWPGLRAFAKSIQRDPAWTSRLLNRYRATRYADLKAARPRNA